MMTGKKNGQYKRSKTEESWLENEERKMDNLNGARLEKVEKHPSGE